MSPPGSRQAVRAFLKKGLHWYKTAAIIFVNTLVLFAVLNVVLHYVYRIKDSYSGAGDPSVENLVFQKYGDAVVLQAYPDLRREEVEELLNESWSIQLVYDPFTLFKEQPRAGKWVNVDAAGFRHVKDQGPWPPAPEFLNVFVFGGSTTFGYGVPDWETIPSRLQEFLQEHCGPQVRVYNFGRGHYYSTQEKLLLERLLGAGHVPGVAVFIDGINDLGWGGEGDEDRPAELQGPLEQAFQAHQQAVTCRDLLAQLPASRAANAASRRLGLVKDEWQLQEPVFDPEARVKKWETQWPLILGRYCRNKQMIEAVCRTFRVTPLFIWQPAPAYKYDLTHHLFANTLWPFEMDRRTFAYPWMAKEVAEHPEDFAGNFLWLADMQQDAKENLYVDQWHYNGKFCRELAARIGGHLVEQKLIGAPK